ncbi:MAG TPA: hypothetical protein VK361_04180, partial [Rubrobacteraceae bacterium]|nr:hypothetical protein [Rubrobacteraceae bacterium]
PMLYRITVGTSEGSISLDLPMHAYSEATSGSGITTGDATEVVFVLEARLDQRVFLQLNVHYAGLPLSKALHYTRFLLTLSSSKGTLYLTRLEPQEESFELVDLPLPWDSAQKEETKARLSLLTALSEVSEATGVEFAYPSKIDEQDLRDLNYILKVIRGGWVALPITDFTTPMDPEGIKNIIDLIGQKGNESGALGMSSPGERVKIFDTWVDLGPSIRHISGARLDTPLSEMKEWLASNPEPQESFSVRWVPVEDAPLHVFFHDWPKPSLTATREDIKAFEAENGKTSEEFRQAWESGEEWAREVEDGDVWLTLLDVERHLQRRM